MANKFWVRGGNSCPMPILCAEILPDLNLKRYLKTSHSLCEFICISALLCMDGTVSLHILETRTFTKLEVVFDFMNCLFTGGGKTTSKLPFLYPPQCYR